MKLRKEIADFLFRPGGHRFDADLPECHVCCSVVFGRRAWQLAEQKGQCRIEMTFFGQSGRQDLSFQLEDRTHRNIFYERGLDVAVYDDARVQSELLTVFVNLDARYWFAEGDAACGPILDAINVGLPATEGAIQERLYRLTCSAMAVLEREPNVIAVEGFMRQYFPHVPDLSSRYRDIVHTKMFRGGSCSPR